jgi:hypothetical protein
VSVLQKLTGEMAAEVLLALNSLYLEEYEPLGSEQQAMERFITARQHSGQPVAVHRLEKSMSKWPSDS